MDVSGIAHENGEEYTDDPIYFGLPSWALRGKTTKSTLPPSMETNSEDSRTVIQHEMASVKALTTQRSTASGRVEKSSCQCGKISLVRLLNLYL